MPEIVNTPALTNIDDVDPQVDERETMVRVNHVSMVFNMASERLNSLKEYALKLIKHQLFFEELLALDDISLEVKKGDVFGIIGTNGSGKSTLLKIIAGVLEPTKGTVDIHGNIAPLIELGAGFDMDLSARENIYLNGALLGYSKEFIQEHFDQIVEFAEIEKFLDMPMKNYSSGMVARIAFAIATVIVPEILIVDEVLSVGDFMFQKKCEERITELIEQHGVTVLIVSHSNDQIARLCNKVAWIEKGHLRLMGKSEDVCPVYDILGGRSGSEASEELIIETLLTEPDQNGRIAHFTQSNSLEGTCYELISQAFPDTCDTVAFAITTTHVNAATAYGLAAAYDAPVAPLPHDHISSHAWSWLEKNHPQRIFVFDCIKSAEQVIEDLRRLSWNPTIIWFHDEAGVHEYSIQILKYGAVHGLWRQDICFISVDEWAGALAVAPLLYDQRTPAIIYGNDTLVLADVLTPLQQTKIENALIVGAVIPEGFAQPLADARLKVERIGASSDTKGCMEISAYVIDKLSPIQGLQFAPYVDGAWLELISSGAFGGRESYPLVFCDETNLNSIEACLSLAHEHRPAPILFIQGPYRFSEAEIRLLSR